VCIDLSNALILLSHAALFGTFGSLTCMHMLYIS
jgi:hypothetical protein